VQCRLGLALPALKFLFFLRRLLIAVDNMRNMTTAGYKTSPAMLGSCLAFLLLNSLAAVFGVTIAN
jgi:hypothetical protein